MSHPTPVSYAYWVEERRLLAGVHPGSPNPSYGKAAIAALLETGVSSFLDLTEAQEHYSYQHFLQQLTAQRAPEYYRRAIPDRHIPSKELMDDILNLIDQAVNTGQIVYVHCLAGIGRTGTVVGCYLVRHGMSGEQALRQIAHLRQATPHAHFVSPETEAQRQFVLNWARET